MGEKPKRSRTWAIIRAILDVDQILIFALLAVTVNQLGHYLAAFAMPGLAFIGYLQAIGIDAAIWRCAHWFKTYNGKNQRRYALLGLCFFLCISCWYNAEYYLSRSSDMRLAQAIIMGAVLPLGVAVVSYLHGVKESSAFANKLPKETEETASEAAPAAATAAMSRNPLTDPGGTVVCDKCWREFPWPERYPNMRAAQNAMNAHKCRSNGDRDPNAIYLREADGDA